jgi:hypothetical protein
VILCYLKRTPEIALYVLSPGDHLRGDLLYIQRKLSPEPIGLLNKIHTNIKSIIRPQLVLSSYNILASFQR